MESFSGFREDFIGITKDNQEGNPCLFAGIKETIKEKATAEGWPIGLIGVYHPKKTDFADFFIFAIFAFR